MKRIVVGLAAVALVLVLAGCQNQSSSGGGSSVSTSTGFLAFPGTSSATFTVSSSGSWTVTSNQSWLSVSPAGGSGSGAVTVSVSRAGLTPGTYAGTLLVQSGTHSATVSALMRFAQVSGNVTGPAGQILPQSVSTTPSVTPNAAYSAGQVLAKVSSGYLTVQGLAPQALNGRVTPQGITAQAVRSAAATIAQAHGMSVRSLIAPSSPWAVLDTGGLSVPQAVAALRSDGRVAAVQPNYLLHLSAAHVPVTTAGISPQATPSDPYYQYQWDMSLLGMPGVWDTVTGSSDVVVGVVDSGVMGSHPDLQANVAYPGYDFVLNQAGATTPDSDGEYHGTHVSGTIGAAAGNGAGIAGMNWHVSILPVRVCDVNGCTTAATMRGIEYAAGLSVYDGNGVLVTPPAQARVINLSLGGSGTWPAVDDAIAYATGNGTVVVAAAGNDGTNCTNPAQYDTGFSPSAVSYPAAYPDTIAVGSVDYDEGASTFAPSCFSNSGAPSSDSQGVTVAAPGGFLFTNGNPVLVPGGIPSPGNWLGLGIVSTWWDNSGTPSTPAYASLVGTSMATPHVVGLVALMLAENPKLTPTYVKLLLEQTASGGGSYVDNYLGYGLISPSAAIADARSLVTANASDFTVELLQGGTLVEQARADAAGNFTLANVPAGSYTVAAGNDANHNGVLGDPGEFYGTASVTVTDQGDETGVGLNVTLQ